MNILGLSRAEFEVRAGLGPGRSQALGLLYRRAFNEGRFEPESAAIAPGAIASLAAGFRVALPEITRVVEEDGPLGVTAKALLKLEDGECVECVRIPVAHAGKASPATLCVSSQVGCRMGCLFCETGRRGLARNLDAGEIVGQLVAARALLGWDIGNIVFMGMGEPLDNFDEVAKALGVLFDRSGPGLSQESVTVCTVGLPEGICRLKGLGYKRLNLSVSLNAADDEARNGLMPANRGVGLAALAAALAAYPQRRNFALAVNYCLIPGLNDGPGSAEAVAAFLARAAAPGRALINLIPYNPGSHPIGRSPTEGEIEAFELRLSALGVQVKLRAPRGRGLMAACGQLGQAEADAKPEA
jgi:23S rRNA (adenine2503-C2)-methyltransferase